MREKIHICGIMFLISIFAFSKFWLPMPNMYFLMLDVVLALIISRYSVAKNIQLFTVSGYLALANLMSYVAVGVSKRVILSFPDATTLAMTILLILILFGELAVLFQWVKITKNCLSTGLSKLQRGRGKLFKGHEEDENYLSHLIANHNIVGVSASWGDGKSFVVDNFCKVHSRQYNIIYINVLAYKYKDADRVLIERLDDIFSTNGIFSVSSSELKNILEHSFLSVISTMLFKYFGIGSSSSSVFESLKADMEKLPKPVLIVFEDLERVGDAAYARQVLAIAYQIASNKCKVIFEYDRNGFKEMGLSTKYLEKFISTEMKITEVTYSVMAKQYWDELHMNDVNFDFPTAGMSCTKNLNMALIELENFMCFDGECPCIMYDKESKGEENYFLYRLEQYMTARKIKMFFVDLKTFFLFCRNIRQLTLTQIRTIIVFYFLKYVRADLYEKLSPKFSLYEMPFIEVDGGKISYKTAIERIKFDKNLKDSASLESKCQEFLFILHLFQYEDIDIVFENHEKDYVKNSEKRCRVKEQHQKEIDSMIGYLLEKGNAQYTDLRILWENVRRILHETNERKRDYLFKSYVETEVNQGERQYPLDQYFSQIINALEYFKANESEWLSFLRLLRRSSYYGQQQKLFMALLIRAQDTNYQKVFYETLMMFNTFEKTGDKLNILDFDYIQLLEQSLERIVWDHITYHFYGNAPNTMEKVNQVIEKYRHSYDNQYLIGILLDLKVTFERHNKEHAGSLEGIIISFLDTNIKILRRAL